MVRKGDLAFTSHYLYTRGISLLINAARQWSWWWWWWWWWWWYRNDLWNYPGFSMPARHRLYRAPPTTLGTTTVPRPPHTSALGIPGEIIAADSRLGERGAWRGALPGTNHSLPGKGTDPRERRDFPTLPEPFLSRVCRHTNLNILIHTLTSR